ncbi:MAG TPA: amino acid adenylation domain-containing protein, partial [Puia sp.]|nr:amino acid adenylation domain-containing protein [Puia sp.]
MTNKIVTEVFERRAAEFPSNVAVSMMGREVTYRELNCQANKLANALKYAGVGKDRIVNVITGRNETAVVSLLAVFKAHGIYLPVELRSAPKRLQYILGSTCHGILIVEKPFLAEVMEMTAQGRLSPEYLIILDTIWRISCLHFRDRVQEEVVTGKMGLDGNNLGLPIDPDDGNYIFFTSGSTGAPKAILGKHLSLAHFIHWEITEFGIDSNFRVSSLIQLTFDASLRDILVPLCAGGTLCIPDPDTFSDMPKLVRWIGEARINLIHTVPSFMRVILAHAGPDRQLQHGLAGLRYLLLAGEPLFNSDILKLREKLGDKIEIVNLYGATESTLIKTFHRVERVGGDPMKAVPVGKPMKGAFVAVVKDGRLCDIGEVGEVLIKSPFLSKGYYRDAEATGKVFIQNPFVAEYEDIVYVTGDLGKILPDGAIELIGRKDDQVKVNGIRVELAEIESAILSCPGVVHAAALTQKDALTINRLIAFYSGEVAEDVLRGHLETLLNRQTTPSLLLKLSDFPMTHNGKIDKKRLEVPAVAAEEEDVFEATGLVEDVVRGAWVRLLNISRIPKTVSFFKLGGHSLTAIQLVSQINTSLGVQLKLADIFENNTIAGLVECVKRKSVSDFPPIEAVAKPGLPYPVSPEQYGIYVMETGFDGKGAYNISLSYFLEGILDEAILSQAFRLVLGRHYSLRTYFSISEGMLRQIVSGEGSNYDIITVDLESEPDRQFKLRQIVSRESAYHFTVTEPPLCRLVLVRVKPGLRVATFTIHHIVADGLSLDVFFRDLANAYNSLLSGNAPQEARLPYQFADFAIWNGRLLDEGFLRESEIYWAELTKDLTVTEYLQLDFPRPSKKTFEGGTVEYVISRIDESAIRDLAERYSVTPYMVLAAGLIIS